MHEWVTLFVITTHESGFWMQIVAEVFPNPANPIHRLRWRFSEDREGHASNRPRSLRYHPPLNTEIINILTSISRFITWNWLYDVMRLGILRKLHRTVWGNKLLTHIF